MDLVYDIGIPDYERERGVFEEFYELTCDGEPMNLNEKATWVISPDEPTQ